MKNKIFFIIFLGFMQFVSAQIEFEARASKTTLGANERLQIDFVMNEDGDNFNPPTFEGFRVMAGPFQSVNYSWINGKKTFSKSFSYVLIPTQKGTFSIKPASIEFDGKIFKTNPIKITVTQAVEQPKNPNSPDYKAGEGVHLVADVSNGNPYVNEPITVVYKLYFDPRFTIRNVKEEKNPKYNNFWSQHIDMKQLKAEPATYNGKDYAMVVWRKVLLYPQKEGKLPIEPLKISMDVEVPTGRRNIFMEPEYAATSKTVTAGDRSINVKPLPENGKPVNFSGAVGSFNFTVSPSKNKLKTNESLQLKISVSGKGNLKLITLPKPEVPTALEMYEPEHTENVETPLSGMAGSITDTYTIVPQTKGKYPIQPLQFTYFDLATKTYKTITSKEIILDVLQGENITNQDPKDTHKQAVTKVSQFEFIQLTTTLEPKNKAPFLGSTWFYIGLLLPWIFIPIIIFIRKKKEAAAADVVGNRIKSTHKLAKKYLSEAYKNLTHKELFYISLEKAIHNFLKAKLHIETAEMSRENIQHLLENKGANNETVIEFLQLMNNCDRARYAPLSDNVMQQDYEKAVHLITQLEKELK